MAENKITFRLCESAAQVAVIAARRLLAAAEEAILARGRFDLVLAGGSTPLAAYTLLADRAADWDRWHIFFGDERCLPPDDPERNSLAAANAFLDRVPIPSANRHCISVELGAESAAILYEDSIRDRLPFDLTLLGMGEDGHTASLFPGHRISEELLVVPVHGAPKPPPDRVSLTPRALAASRHILTLVTGAGKREALAKWRAGEELPIARVTAMAPTEVLMDPAAAGS